MSQDVIDALRQRTLATPLGSRQSAIMRLAQRHDQDGRPFPTIPEIAAHIHYSEKAAGWITESLLGLAVRGLVRWTTRRRTKRGTMPDGWQITPLGKAWTR